MDDLDAMKWVGVCVVVIGIGSVDVVREFLKCMRFLLENLYVDEGGKCYEAFGFASGFGRAGGDFVWMEDKMLFVNGYVKLLLMCVGIGLFGMFLVVFGGYFGLKYKDEIFVEGSNLDVSVIRKVMKFMFGDGYLWFFEFVML